MKIMYMFVLQMLLYLHALLQKKETKLQYLIACCVLIYKELINSRNSIYWGPGF